MDYPIPFKNFLKKCNDKNFQVLFGHELKSDRVSYREIFISIPGATLAGVVQLYPCGFELLFPLNTANDFSTDIADIEDRLNNLKKGIEK